MNKTQKTGLNALTSIVFFVISSIFSLFVGRMILQNLGSDYNGVNATITQLLSVLSLVEGGFTTASLVALYKPYINHDLMTTSVILSTTKANFQKIGLISVVAGAVLSIFYASIIKSSIDYPTIVLIFLISVLQTSFTLAFVSPYRLMFQVAQDEYLINIINAIINVVTQIVTMIVIVLTKSIVFVRINGALFGIMTGLIIIFISKKRYSQFAYNIKEYRYPIKGTREIFWAQLAGTIYGSSTILFVSIFINTLMTSVYSIYNLVINLIKNAINLVITSPQNAIGQVVAEGDKGKLTSIFLEFEHMVIMVVFSLFSALYSILIPAVMLYTKGVKDIDYINNNLSIILIISAVTQLIHIPSGVCITVSGHFKVIKNIQIIACVFLIVFNVIGAAISGFFGIMYATLGCNILLAVLEIGYTRLKILETNISSYFLMIIPNALVALLIAIIEYNLISKHVWNIFSFLMISFAVFGTNALVIYLLNKVLFPERLKSLENRVLSLLKRKSRLNH